MHTEGGTLAGSGSSFWGGLRRRRGLDGIGLAAIAALLIGTAIRFGAGQAAPLWIDETFTGAIAGQPDLAGLLHQIRADVNAPLYYVAVYLWSAIAGISNVALRLLSALFATAAVLLALRGTAGLDRRLCLLWGSLLGLWLPGLHFASEARCYALLLLAATAATLAFARLLTEPTRQAAWAWAALGALAILTHYFAAPLVAAQGLVFLLRHRADALRCWPALGAFLPALAWIAYHAPRLAAFGQPDLAWYALVDSANLPLIVWSVLTSSGSILLVVAMILLVWRRLRGRPVVAATTESVAGGVVLASLLGLAIVLVVGMVRPSFIPRYCVPYVPGMLLGLALVVRSASPLWPRLPVVAVLLFALPALILPNPTRSYSFEAASEAMAKAGVRRLVFLWDHPSSPVQDPAQLRAVGGFFLTRAGHPAEVVAVQNAWREDPQPALLAAAGAASDTAILWLYDSDLPKTAALAHPPRIETLDPSWRCRNHATAPFVALVCLHGRPDGVSPAP